MSDTNPPKSPQNLPNLPAHNPELLKASIAQAREFYRYDSQLTVDDRKKLSSYFWQRLAFFPLAGIPVVVAAIKFPTLLKSRGILDPKKRYIWLQVAFGFMGLGAGFQVGGALAQLVHTSKLAGNEPATQCYLGLSKYPPQLGSKYYYLTAQHPELALHDPDTIDWKRSPVFPVCLILNKDVIQLFINMKNERDANHIDRMNNYQKGVSFPNNSPENAPPLTGTSWDDVIKRNQEQSSPSQSTAQQSTPSRGQTTQNQTIPAGAKQNSEFPPLPDDPANSSSWDSMSTYTPPLPSNKEVSEEQSQFDAMLDKERQDALKDSFSDSEKKWD